MMAWSQSDFWTWALDVLIDSGVKGFALLVLAAIVTMAMHRASAAARHLVWVLALGGLLLIPALALVMPKWQLPIQPHPFKSIAQQVQPGPVDPGLVTEGAGAKVPARSMAAIRPAADASAANAPAIQMPGMLIGSVAPRSPANHDYPYFVPFWLVAGWLVGVLIVLMPLITGLTVIGMRVRQRPSSCRSKPKLGLRKNSAPCCCTSWPTSAAATA